jgi:hypothetical protein
MFLLQNKLAILLSCFTLFLFFVPLLINTAINFPGPVASYMAYSGGNDSHSIGSAVRFLSIYWGGSASLLMGIALLSLLYITRSESKQLSGVVVSMLVIIVAASVALLLYAMFGIDHLEHKYIGMFYYAVPAITISLAALCLYDRVQAPSRGSVTLVISVIFLVITYKTINNTHMQASEYNQPGIVGLYDRLSALKSGGRMVLDLDSSDDWAYLWSRIAGLQVYAKRKGDDLFCIDQNWHILFTAKSRCTEEELVVNKRFLVKKTSSQHVDDMPVLETMGLSFYGSAVKAIN